MKDLAAEEFMIKNPTTMEHNSSIGVARSLLLGEGISHLPIVGRDGLLVGLLRARDLVLNFVKPKEKTRIGERIGERTIWTKMKISGLGDKHPLQVGRKTKIFEITRQMIDKNRSACIVVEHSLPVGIITPRDIIAILKQFKPKLQIPLYVVGVGGVENDSIDLIRHKIERVATRGLRMHSDKREIIVHMNYRAGSSKERRRIEMRARVYTSNQVMGVGAEGWSSLPSVTDELSQKLDKRLSRAKDQREHLAKGRARTKRRVMFLSD